MSKTLYGKKHLIEALKDAGLPYSKPTLLDYEAKGIIPSPQTNVEGNASRPLYTQEEIDNIVELVRKHKET